ncbi:MAG TPA: serine/threonine-protein kinase [Bryobacteraceae bacterium]|jgi:serine/threonine-protein kinase
MTPVRVSDTLDHYRIESVVARSGMASIFKATDLNDGKTVAVKVPHPEMEAEPVLFDRFKREAEIGMMLNHPAVMKVYDYHQGDHVYMVMEWVEGTLLRHILRSGGPLSEERAIRLTTNILGALEHIHSRGVAHRDLKPENIMVDDDDNVKLIDFGIASKSDARRLTFGKLSQVMGTPDYISPEQVKGKRGDGRSDIYSTGIMLYEMLTGKVPFTGENPFAIMNERVLNNPVPPRAVNPQISPEMQEVIYRALEREPTNRYKTAEEFAWDLQHLDQVGVSDNREELTNWKKRRDPWARKIAFYIAMALIPVVVLGLLFWVAKHA